MRYLLFFILIASSGLAQDIRDLEYPLYANHNQGTRPRGEFTEAEYDSIASLDLYYPQMDLFDPTHPFENFVTEVRSRNPDIIVLDYWYAWGVSDNWAEYTVGSVRRSLYDFIEANDFWMYDAYNRRVPYMDPTWGLYHINIAAPMMAEAFSSFIASFVNNSSNLQDYVGIYLDYFDWYYFANWACNNGCQNVIDIDRDGLHYSSSPEEAAEELALYQQAQINLVTLIRQKVKSKKFIVTANGTSWQAVPFAPYVDIGLYEKIHIFKPTSEAEWRRCVFNNAQPFLRKELFDINPIIYDYQGYYYISEEPLLAVSLATLGYAQISTNAPIDGRRFWNPLRSEHGKISLGKDVNQASWPENSEVVYRQFEKGYIKFIPLEGWPYSYVVVDTLTKGVPDTLLISNDWVNRHPKNVQINLKE